MSIYKSKNTTVKDAGSSFEAGSYKFKVASSEVHSGGNIMLKLKTWTEDGKEGPNIIEWLNITSDKQGALDEVDRRLQVMLGKLELNDASELVGKAGFIILRKGPKYLEAMPFGGFYTTDRKSAAGNESMSERVAEALDYVAPAPAGQAASPEDDATIPF